MLSTRRVALTNTSSNCWPIAGRGAPDKQLTATDKTLNFEIGCFNALIYMENLPSEFRYFLPPPTLAGGLGTATGDSLYDMFY